MRHDPGTTAGYFQALRPPGNLHTESAPRSGLHRPQHPLSSQFQEHLHVRRAARPALPDEKTGLMHPVRLLQCPGRASLLHPRGLPQVPPHLTAGRAPVTGVFPAGARITPSGDWASGNPAFAISRGSPGAPPRTPGHGHRFPGLLFSPTHLSDHGSAIRSKDTSSSPCPLRGRYSSAPRGARKLRACWAVQEPSGWAVTPRMCTCRGMRLFDRYQYLLNSG